METNTGFGATTGRDVEGRATRAIEKQTAKAPSGVYLSLAIASIVGSAAVMLSDLRRPARRLTRDRSGLANFIGQWAPTLLIIGLYNKVVKLENEMMERG